MDKFIDFYQQLVSLPRHLSRNAVIKITDNWNSFIINEIDAGNTSILQDYRFKTQYHIKDFKDKFEKRIRQILWLDENATIITRLRSILRQGSDPSSFLEPLSRTARRQLSPGFQTRIPVQNPEEDVPEQNPAEDVPISDIPHNTDNINPFIEQADDNILVEYNIADDSVSRHVPPRFQRYFQKNR